VMAMELTDRLNKNKYECGQACRCMLSILKTTNSKKIILCVELLEILSKNCDLNFHRYIGTKQYAQVFLKLLER